MAASKSLNSEDKDFLVMMEAAFQKRNKKTDIILNLLKSKNDPIWLSRVQNNVIIDITPPLYLIR